ncbi:MAG TPA: N-acetyltransferase [Gaiellaceae bacterium]|nr:N-acetyltransferase [Gaiellaceae bacterium]
MPLVELMRASPGYLPNLALVADDDGDVIGHIMFTESTVEGSDATILILSPLAVRPDRQRRGIGSALVREGLRRAEEHGAPLVIVEGDPRYYSRFGFRRALELGLERPHEQIPEVAFQALPLAAYDPSLRGKVVYPPPFDSVA